MKVLRFETLPGQLRRLRTFLIVVTITGLLPAVLAFLTRGGVNLRPVIAFAGFLELLGIVEYVTFARAFSECTPAGIRTRVFVRLTAYPWSQVADVSVRQIRTTAKVMVTTVDGSRFMLGAPVVDILMVDPEFDSKARQIQAYWWSAVASDCT